MELTQIFREYVMYNLPTASKEDYKLALNNHPNPVGYFLSSRLIEEPIIQLRHEIIEDLIELGDISSYRDEAGYNLIGILLSCSFFSSIYDQVVENFIKMYELLLKAGVDDYNIDLKKRSTVDFMQLIFFDDTKPYILSQRIHGTLAAFFYNRFRKEFEQRGITL